nr:agmatine deiminase family protein [Faecalicoccus pleomorphus]
MDGVKRCPIQRIIKFHNRYLNKKNFPIIDVSYLVMEGGSMEISADGTLMATKSSVVSNNRNASLTQTQVEDLLKKYLGVKRFIWLNGVLDEDITDAHIDGFACFLDKDTILTVPEDYFYDLFEGISEKDYDLLHSATNANGNPYQIIEIPLTKNNVRGLDYKGSYLNYYVGNQSVLLPVYEDPNDEVAVHIMKELFPDKTIVPIDVRALYKNGGMIHCVTQQQPLV